MPTSVGIIDYGMGNLRSVAKALEAMGAKVYVGDSVSHLRKTDRLILPGVGAFGDAMKELKRRKLLDMIYKYSDSQKPFLGICLGLQLFLKKSAESDKIKGLGIWKGTVDKFIPNNKLGIKVPHMGWNQIKIAKRNRSEIVADIPNNSFFYFVHSYYVNPTDRSLIVGETDYSVEFPSILQSNHVFGVQFHPEKSQAIGLRILKTFFTYHANYSCD